MRLTFVIKGIFKMKGYGNRIYKPFRPASFMPRVNREFEEIWQDQTAKQENDSVTA